MFDNVNPFPKLLLIFFIVVVMSLFSHVNLRAGVSDWFCGNTNLDLTDTDSSSYSGSKQENLNILLDTMNLDNQMSEQVDLILKLSDQPLIELMRAIKKDFPEGEQASGIIHGNFSKLKQNIMDSIDYKQIYYQVYNDYYNNEEIMQLIKIFKTPIGQKLLKNNLEINKKILLAVQPKILEAIFAELPKMNKRIMTDFIDSDYLDKIIDSFKSEFKQELRKLLAD